MTAIAGWKRGVAKQLHPKEAQSIIKGTVYAGIIKKGKKGTNVH